MVTKSQLALLLMPLFSGFGDLKTINLGHFCAYCTLTAGVEVLLTKIYGFLENLCHFDSILIFDGMYIFIGRNNTGNTDEILSIIGEAPFPLTLSVEEATLSRIVGKGDVDIFLYGILSLTCLFSSIP